MDVEEVFDRLTTPIKQATDLIVQFTSGGAVSDSGRGTCGPP